MNSKMYYIQEKIREGKDKISNSHLKAQLFERWIIHAIKWGNFYPVDNTILLLVEQNIIIISLPDTYSICWMMIYLVDSAIQSLKYCSQKKFFLR